MRVRKTFKMLLFKWNKEKGVGENLIALFLSILFLIFYLMYLSLPFFGILAIYMYLSPYDISARGWVIIVLFLFYVLCRIGGRG